MTSSLVSQGDLVLAAEDLSMFGQDPWWLVVIKAVLIFLVLVLLTLFNIWFERRVVARMHALRELESPKVRAALARRAR